MLDFDCLVGDPWNGWLYNLGPCEITFDLVKTGGEGLPGITDVVLAE